MLFKIIFRSAIIIFLIFAIISKLNKDKKRELIEIKNEMRAICSSISNVYYINPDDFF
jgi:hypothetical protein